MNKTLWSVLLSTFCVVFLWGFWSEGPFALGINAFVYLVGLIFFFLSILRREKRYHTSDLAWIIPLLLIALNFALYENPFFKIFSLLVFPVVLAFFYNYAFVEEKAQKIWNLAFIFSIVKRVFSAIPVVGPAVLSLVAVFSFKREGPAWTFERVLIGVSILIVALIIILPLLSSADAAFAQKLGVFSNFIQDIFSSALIGKMLVFAIFSIGTLSIALGWGRSHEITNVPPAKPLDPLVTGIVVSGILAFYLLFLWVQLDRLWVGALPFEFSETEDLVKSGFWQLLFLSFLNLLIFFVLYRKTAPVVQKILSVFTIASLLILVSAGQRMILYVTTYGFSYEKFYALYAVLFCGILFLWLLSRLFVASRSNILKFVAFQFLWMFALVGVFPVEQFIVHSNVALAKHDDTRIILFEMNMLSPDVLKTITTYHKAGLLTENSQKIFDWNPWIEEQQEKLARKKWYEMTLSSVLNW